MFEQHSNATVVSRQSLYEGVWSKPMTVLAKEYGISDVALAKICRKLDIPCPQRGYWRKKETGKVVKQLPLTPNHHANQQNATIHRTLRPEVSLSEDVAKRIVAEQCPEQKIEVPERLGKTHRLFTGHLTDWRSASVDEYGAIRQRSLRQLKIRVSPKSLSRAVRIMNTLFLALETRGYLVGIQDGYNKVLGVSINGEPVEFGIEEKFRRTERAQDKLRQDDSWIFRRYEYVPTGILTLKIDEYVDGLQKSWSDGKTMQLEACLNAFIVGLLNAAEALRARRLQREQEALARLEAERRRQEEEQRRQEELAKRQTLLKEAENWTKAQQLRAYLSAVKEALIKKHGAIQQGSTADQWLAWAYQQAESFDPLRSE